MIKAIIGLGNPTKEYEYTYHNLGKFIVKNLEGKLEAKIIAPAAYMNVSGETVKKELRRLKLRVNEITVAHDDSDLAFGTVRFYFDGSSAGHKGIESIVQALKNNRFWRMRIGSRSIVRVKAGEFALKKMRKSEITMIEKNLPLIKKWLERFIAKPEKSTFHLNP